MTEDSGFLFPVDANDFSLSHTVQTGSETKRLLLCNGNRGGKVRGTWTEHSPPSSAEVKNGDAIPPLPQ
jgi:hypothetical protein